jgi:biotin operon repressor
MGARNDWRDAVWESELPSLAKLLALAYADHAEPDGARVWVSWERLAERTGMGNGSVGRQVKVLRDGGWLTVVDPGKGRRPTRYRLSQPNRLSPTVELKEQAAEQSLSPTVEVNGKGSEVALSPKSGVVALPQRTTTTYEPQGYVRNSPTSVVTSREGFGREGDRAGSGSHLGDAREAEPAQLWPEPKPLGDGSSSRTRLSSGVDNDEPKKCPRCKWLPEFGHARGCPGAVAPSVSTQ